MSRHRNLRKVSIGDDDYDDDIAQSYDDKYSFAVSPGTSEMYMFNRSSENQNMSEFMKGKILEEEGDDEVNEEEEDEEEKASGNTSSTQQTQQLSQKKNKLDEDFMFQMDKETHSSFNTSQQKNNDSTAISAQSKKPKEILRNDLKSATNPITIESTASPKSLKKTQAQQQVKTPASTIVTATNNNKALNTSSTSGVNTNTTSNNSKPSFLSLNELKLNSSASNENLKKFQIDKDQLLRQYEEHTAGKDVINLIIIGHVDAGKSTLMGHLLFQLGQVSGKLMHKYKQESQKIGKGSFAYAWILDETEEERTRGITIDIAQTKFETEKKVIYLMDAPGHKDFIPNFITGASHADSAILVVNSITGEFETGFSGQTREHALLVKSLGVTQLIVAVNKMDMHDWSRERFEHICKKLGTFLVKQVGFKEADIMYVPLSGLVGENLTKLPSNEKLTSWYNESLVIDGIHVTGGLSLLDCINRFRPYERAIDKPLRFCVSDVYKSLQTAAISLAGKLETGSVKCGDKICVMPANEIGQVKSITNNEEQSSLMAYAGDTVILNVSNVDMNNMSVGNFVCDCIWPSMPVSDRLKAKIVLFNLEMPLIKGFSVVFHYKSMSESAIIKKLISQLDKSSGDVIKERPRFLTKGMSAMVEIKINRPICMELYSNYRELGRFMLRLGDTTIAAGLITDILIPQ